MGVNLAEVKRMIAVSRRVRRIAMAALCYRYRPHIQAARELVQSGALGNIYHARVKYLRRRGVPGIGNWWTTKACGGGALADIGVHVADAALFIAGLPMPTHASAVTYRKFGHRKDYACLGMWGIGVPGGPMDVEDYASGFIRFGGKMTMTVEISWAAEIQSGAGMEVLGDRGGLLILDDDSPHNLTLYTQRGNKLVEETVATQKVDRFHLQARHFVDCILNKRKPLSDLTTTLPVQAVLDGMYRSSESGREIRI
jgi:predicted dehydrogenase